MNSTDLSSTKSEEIKQLKKSISRLQEENKQLKGENQQLQEENQQLKVKIQATATCSSCDEVAEICAACNSMICSGCLTYNSGSCESCEVSLCEPCFDKTWCRSRDGRGCGVQFCTTCPAKMEKCPSCDKSHISIRTWK